MNYQFEILDYSDVHIKALYKLLKDREHVISHREIPDFKSHKEFVINNPYLYWYLIKFDNTYIGSVYIKSDNSIGLNLSIVKTELIKSCIDFIKKNFSPNLPEASMIPNYFFLNVPATNKDLIKQLRDLYLTEFQVSFKIE